MKAKMEDERWELGSARVPRAVTGVTAGHIGRCPCSEFRVYAARATDMFEPPEGGTPNLSTRNFGSDARLRSPFSILTLLTAV
jgi:hypothetical protein